MDRALRARSRPVPVEGPLDESAHLLSSGLALSALAPRRTRRHWPWVLLGSVAIDVDHVPLFLGLPVAPTGGRPAVHSLPTVAALATLAKARPRLRIPAGGLALGVVLHFVRDVATGPGALLLWPARSEDVRVPHRLYVGVLAALAGVAAVGDLRARLV